MNRNNFINYLQQEYTCDIDYPWKKYPDYVSVIFRAGTVICN